MKIDVSHITGDPDYYNDVYLSLFDKDKRTYVLYGGRDSGKSDFIAQKLILDCLSLPYFKGILVRKRFNSIRESQYATIKEVAGYMGLDSLFHFTKTPLEIICTANGNRFIARGCDDTRNLKSVKDPTHIWLEEADQISEDDYDTISFSLRNSKGVKEREFISFNSGDPGGWIVKRFFPTKNIGGEIVLDNYFENDTGEFTYIDSPDNDAVVLHTCYKHNQFITPDRIARHEKNKERYPNKYKIDGLGLMGVIQPGALWAYNVGKEGNEGKAQINRVDKAPELVRVGIAVDPSITSKTSSDECGIIYGGLGIDGKVYIFGDASGIMGPNQWAARTTDIYEAEEADFVVAEKNQGGDMILSVFENVGAPFKPKLVHAYRGKRLRAEPVAALYGEKKVFHVGTLSKLENEMVSWDSSGKGKSPNRIDAMVYLVMALTGKRRRAATSVQQNSGGVIARSPIRK